MPASRKKYTRDCASKLVECKYNVQYNFCINSLFISRFRWVQCQLNTLQQCMTAVEIREALDDLPSDLDATYERILLDIHAAKREGKVARRALDWLVVALQPLQLSQIMEGLSIDLGRRVVDCDSGPVHGSALLDALGSLVMYDEVTDIVILSHYSVKVCLMLCRSLVPRS